MHKIWAQKGGQALYSFHCSYLSFPKPGCGNGCCPSVQVMEERICEKALWVNVECYKCNGGIEKWLLDHLYTPWKSRQLTCSTSHSGKKGSAEKRQLHFQAAFPRFCYLFHWRLRWKWWIRSEEEWIDDYVYSHMPTIFVDSFYLLWARSDFIILILPYV